MKLRLFNGYKEPEGIKISNNNKWFVDKSQRTIYYQLSITNC